MPRVKKSEIIEQREELVQQYIKSVRSAVEQEYGSIPGEYEAQLRQLEDMYRAYLKCAEEFRNENPVIMINNGKTAAPNIKFKVMVESINSMDRLIKSFGLSPLAKTRIKRDVVSVEEDDYLDSI
jgi:phage terminase small subunit